MSGVHDTDDSAVEEWFESRMHLAAAPADAISPDIDPAAICLCGGPPGQGRLFDIEPTHVSLHWMWPQVSTGPTQRVGFWRRRTPDVFGDGAGVGPLLILPDTNVLIDLYENLDAVEGVAFLAGPVTTSDHWDTPVDALRDLIQLWWWRDIRFHTGIWHLSDYRKTPPPPARRAALERAVQAFGQDYFTRGSDKTSFDDGVHPADARCPLHDCVIPLPALFEQGARRLPSAALDRRMVSTAIAEGSNVFLTSDRKILRRHPGLLSRGLSIHSPQSLMRALCESGETTEAVSTELAPDLGALAAFYALRSENDFDDQGVELPH